MARLIPSCMDERTPPAERDVFNLLAAGPDAWVALHSLDLAPWNHGLRTEIDFVVIIPEKGILCIEVKSHDQIAFDGSRWIPQTISRSPFKQAADGRYAFRRRLVELAPQFRGIPIVHCCMFPRAAFALTPNLSVQPWELMDRHTFRAFRSAEAFCNDLASRVSQSINADGSVATLVEPMSRGHIDRIVEFCTPVRKWRPTDRDEIKRREEESERVLREQQKPVLRLAELNERMIVSGAAGTGKTLIAFEVARRAAESGRRVALLCYNQLVGSWTRKRAEQLSPVLPNLIAGRAIQVMAEMAGIKIPSDPPQDFWEVELPRNLEERLTDPEFNAAARLDYLVLDESQDILARPVLWQCLMQFLAGGVEHGNYVLFGDFDYQVLTARPAMEAALAAIEQDAHPGRWRLSENCRNYALVGETAVRLSGLGDAVYSGYLRVGGSVNNYDILFYEDDRTQLDTLAKWLAEFKKQGYRPADITLLSFRSDMRSAAARLKHAGFKLRPAWQGGDATSYASVHAFKGLENKIVIITDVVLGNHENDRDLFYVGMTRATETVRVLCDRTAKETISAWLTRRACS